MIIGKIRVTKSKIMNKTEKIMNNMTKFNKIINNFQNEIGKTDYVKDFSLEQIKKIDTENMYQLLKDYGKHISSAINTASAVPKDNTKSKYITKNIIILGIGGSAMAGELLKSYIRFVTKDIGIRITIIRGTTVPKRISRRSIIFCCSYSGNTFETLTALNRIKKVATNNIIAITSGGKLEDIAIAEGYELLKLPSGMMPRCSVFYSFFHLLYALFRLDMITDFYKENINNSIREVLDTSFIDESLDYSSINNENISFILARCCQNKIPIIYTGAERLEAVNLRWKAQIQENANQLCFGNYYPEVNHNEINGWMFPSDLLNRFIVIAMKDIEDSDLLNISITNSLELLREMNIEVIEVVVNGKTLLERIIRLICIADWCSFYLAIMNEADPTSIPVIMKLKEKV